MDLIPAAVASVAAIIDFRSRTIPNWLTLSAILGGLLIHVASDGARGIGIAVAGAALGLGLLLPFYAIHALGAGDVKLLAALGALVGPQAIVSVAVYGALVGGVISIVLLVKGGTLRRSVGELVSRPRRLTRIGARAPYGVAIASGVYLSMLLPGVIG